MSISTVLNKILHEKRARAITVALFVAIIIGILAFFMLGAGSKDGLISSKNISISGTQGDITYGSNDEFFFALLTDTYYKIPKRNPCKGFAPNDYKTWCQEWSTPNSY